MNGTDSVGLKTRNKPTSSAINERERERERERGERERERERSGTARGR